MDISDTNLIVTDAARTIVLNVPSMAKNFSNGLLSRNCLILSNGNYIVSKFTGMTILNPSGGAV